MKPTLFLDIFDKETGSKKFNGFAYSGEHGFHIEHELLAPHFEIIDDPVRTTAYLALIDFGLDIRRKNELGECYGEILSKKGTIIIYRDMMPIGLLEGKEPNAVRTHLLTLRGSIDLRIADIMDNMSRLIPEKKISTKEQSERIDNEYLSLTRGIIKREVKYIEREIKRKSAFNDSRILNGIMMQNPSEQKFTRMDLRSEDVEMVVLGLKETYKWKG